ncbi:MAG TPA: hypothetical protein VFB76_04990 [Candidatus Angelobacter sp.]|nr:hypothetical protein [Candidatus Angelobacter sp.]
MKNFTCIKEALDFAAGNQHRLKFPFTCKCNGFPVRVLSPELARTVGREPSLVATRTASAGLELGYIVTVRALKNILRSLAIPGIRYALAVYADRAAVEYGPASGSTEFSFPIVKRVADIPQEEGTFILLKAPQQTKGWQQFWLPLETHLLRSALNPAA